MCVPAAIARGVCLPPPPPRIVCLLIPASQIGRLTQSNSDNVFSKWIGGIYRAWDMMYGWTACMYSQTLFPKPIRRCRHFHPHLLKIILTVRPPHQSQTVYRLRCFYLSCVRHPFSRCL